MKLSFESNLQYQREAIQAVARLFEGQAQDESVFQYDLNEQQASLIDGVGNDLVLSEEQMLSNLQNVQRQNEITPSEQLDRMHFSIEMETDRNYINIRIIYG